MANSVKKIDNRSLEILNSRPPLKQSFNLLSSLGFQVSLQATPILIATYLSFVIGVGGSPTFIFGYIFGVSLQLFICASLAEIASAYPHPSGQIYWTAVLAPKKYARFLSYVVGWLTCASFLLAIVSGYLLSSKFIFSLVSVCESSFVAHHWHYYLGLAGVAIVSLIMNVHLFSFFPYFTRFLAVWINGGAIFLLVALLARAHPKQSASYVFTDFVNVTGWSNGATFFLGLLPGVTSVFGFDGVAHLADEIPDPGRHVPQVMMGSSVIAAISGLPMIITLMFCVVNPANLLHPIGGQPAIQLLLDSLNSLPLTIIGTLIFIVTTFGASVCTATTFSRVWWSFAREGGVPFSKFFARTSTQYQVPINANIFTAVACITLGLLELGSTTALNAIIGGAALCIFAAYAITIVCFMLRRGASPHKYYFHLGRFGMFVNVVSIAWICFISVWICFPIYLPVTAGTMNYASAVALGVLLITFLNWMANSRKLYSEPGDFRISVARENTSGTQASGAEIA